MGEWHIQGRSQNSLHKFWAWYCCVTAWKHPLLFLRNLNFSIDNKPSNLETQSFSRFGSKGIKFEECKTHLLGKTLSKNQNKMEKGPFLAVFPHFLLLIQTAFVGCTLDNWIMSLNFSTAHQFIFCDSTGSDWKPRS